MAISTYSELQTSIGNWLNRSDLTTHIPDFITLCEARVNRNLRIRAMEYRATQSISAEYVSLPTGSIELRYVRINRNPRKKLGIASIDYIEETYGGETGTPDVFALIGDEIQLGPAPDATYTMEVGYYKSFDALSDVNPTNWLITNAPDVYLYGALVEASVFLMNDERISVWQAFYDRAINDLMASDKRDRLSGSQLRTRPV